MSERKSEELAKVLPRNGMPSYTRYASVRDDCRDLKKLLCQRIMGSKFGCLANRFIVLQDHKRLPARFFARVSGALDSRLS